MYFFHIVSSIVSINFLCFSDSLSVTTKFLSLINSTFSLKKKHLSFLFSDGKTHKVRSPDFHTYDELSKWCESVSYTHLRAHET